MAIDEILAHKRAEIAARKAARPFATLRAEVEPSERDFVRALAQGPGPAFLLEVKPASPSEGPLRHERALDPAIAAYRRHATAISVLADRRFFGGSLELLARVRAAVPQPVLCKDFVVEPYQVYEARRFGADAVLLILSVLDDAAYAACAAAARDLGMGVLTEVHTTQEMRRARALGAQVVGINNRDLRTLAIVRETTSELAPLAPKGAVVIAESGLRNHGDVARLRDEVDGFLVGTVLMRSADPDRSVRELIYGRTKVCGLTRAADAARAIEAGATHGGLVFAAESPRSVTPEEAGVVCEGVPLEWVAVFVNESRGRVAGLARTLDLAAVQLHGEESAADIADLRGELPAACEIWKAVRVRDRVPEPAEIGADRVLLDGHAPGRRGGTGRRFDWTLLAGRGDLDRYVLSGGLTPDTVAEATGLGIEFLDVSSGVEARPGLKDPGLLTRFFAARRGPRRRAGS